MRFARMALVMVAALNAGVVFADSSTELIVLGSRGRAERVRRSIPELSGRESFDHPDFRIVLKKEESALPLRTDPEIQLKANTTFYHLLKAKRYFLEELKSPDVEKLGQVTVRLELTNKFSSLGHFQNDNKDPQYNNALSVPEGKDLRTGAPWSKEIWFRPLKEIPIRDVLAQAGEDPMNPLIRELNASFLPAQIDVGIRTFIIHTFGGARVPGTFLGDVTQQAGTLLLIEGALQASKLLNRALLPRTYYVDTAAVPEISYHEFTHVALSDYLEVSHSTPVIEGLADYFAADISKNPRLYQKIRGVSKAMPRNGRKPKAYQASFEKLANAHSDFVLAMLWGIRDQLGPKKANEVIFESRKYLNTRKSDIRGGLVSALFKACETLCEHPDSDRLKLARYFDGLGL